jgi:hypothetical protein
MFVDRDNSRRSYCLNLTSVVRGSLFTRKSTSLEGCRPYPVAGCGLRKRGQVHMERLSSDASVILPSKEASVLMHKVSQGNSSRKSALSEISTELIAVSYKSVPKCHISTLYRRVLNQHSPRLQRLLNKPTTCFITRPICA